MQEKQKTIPKAEERLAREKIIRSKFYKIMAIALAFASLFVIFHINQKLSNGNPYHVLENPLRIFVLLFPLVPSLILAMLSKKNKAEAVEVLEPHCETMSASELQALKDDA